MSAGYRNKSLHPLQLSIQTEDMNSAVSTVGRTSGSYQASEAQRKSPLLAVSADYYNHALLIPTSDYSSNVSIEMSMKTIEMLAMIKGTTYEEAFLLDSAPHLDDEGRTSTEGSSVPPQGQEDFELDFEDDYLVGDTFIGYTEDSSCAEYLGRAPAEEEEEEYEPEEEIFEIEI